MATVAGTLGDASEGLGGCKLYSTRAHTVHVAERPLRPESAFVNSTPVSPEKEGHFANATATLDQQPPQRTIKLQLQHDKEPTPPQRGSIAIVVRWSARSPLRTVACQRPQLTATTSRKLVTSRTQRHHYLRGTLQGRSNDCHVPLRSPLLANQSSDHSLCRRCLGCLSRTLPGTNLLKPVLVLLAGRPARSAAYAAAARSIELPHSLHMLSSIVLTSFRRPGRNRNWLVKVSTLIH